MAKTAKTRSQSTPGRKPRPVSAESQSFGAHLLVARTRAGATQNDVASWVGLSGSFLARVERGVANVELSRFQVWQIIEKLRVAPRDCDALLTSAGLSTNRSPEEELILQSVLPDLREVWVFARSLTWLSSETERLWSLGKCLVDGLNYRFFVPDVESFNSSMGRLLDEVGYWGAEKYYDDSNPDDFSKAEMLLRQRIECFVLPQVCFTTDFCIYNPGQSDMYCCGSKVLRGDPHFFFTNEPAEGEHLYQMLRSLVDHIDRARPINIGTARKVYPDLFARESQFRSEPGEQQAKGFDMQSYLDERLKAFESGIRVRKRAQP